MNLRFLFALLLLFFHIGFAHAGTFTVTNTNSSGTGSLRAAIVYANANAGTRIVFQLPATTTVPVIDVGEDYLPAITANGTVIVGPTSKVQLIGEYNVLTVEANDCTISGLVVNVFHSCGVSLYGNRNRLYGCYFGTNSAGTAIFEPDYLGPRFQVYVKGDQNVIGSDTTSASRTVICKATIGVGIEGNDNSVVATYIGTGADGRTVLAQKQNENIGIAVSVLGDRNRIGGGGSSGNVIAGFDQGIAIDAVDKNISESNTVYGNQFGIEGATLGPLGQGSGVLINGAIGTIIGDSSSGRGNRFTGCPVTISIWPGMSEATAPDSNTTIYGNTFAPYTGQPHLSSQGLPLTNVCAIAINGVRGVTVGGTGTGQGNTFDGYTIGIQVSGASSTDSNNATVTWNATGNTIRGNTFNNISSRILDLAAVGDVNNPGFMTPNDVGDADEGNNLLQNFPTLSRAVSQTGGGILLSGTLNSRPSSSFSLDFYGGTQALTSGYGVFGGYLGSTTVSTDATGNGAFSFLTAATLPLPTQLCATATDSAGNTSEFGQSIPVFTPTPNPTATSTPTPVPVVVTVGDGSVLEGNDGTTAMVFPITFSSSPLPRSISWNYRTLSNTAVAGVDFVARQGTITMDAGTQSASLVVSVLGDTLVENDETFTVYFSGIQGGVFSNGQTTLSVTGTIRNDDVDPTPTPIATNTPTPTFTPEPTPTELPLPFTLDGQTFELEPECAPGLRLSPANVDAPRGTRINIQSDSAALNQNWRFERQENGLYEIQPLGAPDQRLHVFYGRNTLGTITDSWDDLSDNSQRWHPIYVGDGYFEFEPECAPGLRLDVEGMASAPGTWVNLWTDLSNAAQRWRLIPVTATPTPTPTATPTATPVPTATATPAPTATWAPTPVPTATPTPVPPVITVVAPSVYEGNSGTTAMKFTLKLSKPSTKPVQVYVQSGAASLAPATANIDYVPLGRTTISFVPGQTSQTATVQVKGDLLDEDNKRVKLVLGSPVNATLGSTSSEGVIVDDDGVPLVAVNDISLAEGNSGLRSMVFFVKLSNPSSKTITVNWATQNGTAIGGTSTTTGADYVNVTSTPLAFMPGQTSKTVTVLLRGDLVDEEDETFTIKLASPLNARIGDGIGIGTIVDDDATPKLLVKGSSVVEGNGGTAKPTLLPFTVTLSGPSSRTVTVGVRPVPGTTFPATANLDYKATSVMTLSFAPGETSKTVSVAVIGDLLNEDNERIALELSRSLNAVIGQNLIEGLVTNDDALPALSIGDVNVLEGNVGMPVPSVASFAVSLNAPSAKEVRVDYASFGRSAAAGTDYLEQKGTLVFAPGETRKTVPITLIGDAQVEPNEVFVVTLSRAVNATMSKAIGNGIILNDDRSTASTLAAENPPDLTINPSVITF